MGTIPGSAYPRNQILSPPVEHRDLIPLRLPSPWQRFFQRFRHAYQIFIYRRAAAESIALYRQLRIVERRFLLADRSGMRRSSDRYRQERMILRQRLIPPEKMLRRLERELRK